MGVTEGSKRLKGRLLSHISHGVFWDKVGEKKMRYVRNKQIPVDETWNREEADKLVKGYVDDVIGQNPPGLSSWASSRGLMPLDDQLDTAYEKQELVGIRSAIDALTNEWHRLTAWKIEADAIDSLPENIRKNKETAAETIENNVRRLIIDELPTNPKYYERMSVLLDELIRLRKVAAQNYAEYLKRIVELTKQVKNPAVSVTYPTSLHSKARRALYDNLDRDEALAVALDEAILSTKKDGWRGNKIKEREVLAAIKMHVEEESAAYQVFELVKSQGEY